MLPAGNALPVGLRAVYLSAGPPNKKESLEYSRWIKGSIRTYHFYVVAQKLLSCNRISCGCYCTVILVDNGGSGASTGTRRR